MSKEINHTPLPWIEQGQGMLLHPVSHATLLTNRVETPLGSFEILDETNEPTGNYLFILKACNNHYKLVEMLKNITDHLDAISPLAYAGSRSFVDKAREVLKEVKG